MGKHPGTWLAIALLGAGHAAAQADVTRTGKTFVVTVHPGKLDEALATRLADEALAAAESVRPALQKWQIAATKPPALHLHADPATFRGLEKTNTNFPFVVEDFCVADGGEAHVLLWPQLSEEVLGVLGLPPGVAQSLHRCAAQATALQASESARKDPWLAQVFGYAVLEATTNPKASYGIDPAFDTRRQLFARHREQGNAVNLAGLLVDERIVDRAGLDLHVERVSLTAQLCASAGSGWARKFLAKQPIALPTVAARAALVDAVLGKDTAKNEQRFAAMMAGLKPTWLTGVREAGARDGLLLIAGTKAASANLDAYRLPPDGPFAIRAKVRFVGGHRPQCRFTFYSSEEESLAVIVAADEGLISVWSNGARKWKDLVQRKASAPLDRAFEVAIEVTDEVRALVDGVQVVSAPCKDRNLHCAWGIHVNDNLVSFENLRCEPLAPAKKK